MWHCTGRTIMNPLDRPTLDYSSPEPNAQSTSDLLDWPVIIVSWLVRAVILGMLIVHFF